MKAVKIVAILYTLWILDEKFVFHQNVGQEE